MKAELSQAGLKALEDFADAERKVRVMSDCDSFMDGFRMGVLMMLDVLGREIQPTP